MIDGSLHRIPILCLLSKAKCLASNLDIDSVCRRYTRLHGQLGSGLLVKAHELPGSDVGSIPVTVGVDSAAQGLDMA